MAEGLTKKQQKALAFKSKQKSKRRGDGEVEQEDVPERDLLDDEGNEVPAEEAKAEVKKSKKDKEPVVDAAEESEKKKGKRKKTAWDDEEEGEAEAEKPAKKSKKDVQQRFILFVGNLGFKTTKDRVEAVFRQALGETPSVRLLTNKPKPGSTMGPTSRGIAFVEFTNSTLLQQALKLHHTDLDGRRINVELTVGGGGSGSARKEKLDEKKGRMAEQRDRKAEKEAVAEAASGAAEAPQAIEGAVKMRGGRRIKPKTPDQSGPPRGGSGYSRGGGSGPSRDRGGRGGAGGAGRGGGRGGFGGGRDGGYGGGRGGGRGGSSFAPRGKKWEPTGANAVSVG